MSHCTPFFYQHGLLIINFARPFISHQIALRQIIIFMCFFIVCLQALAAPGSSRSRTATGTTTASPAPRARRRWWDAASSLTAMILFAPSAPSKSLCKLEKHVPQPLCCLTQKRKIIRLRQMRSSNPTPLFTCDTLFLFHTTFS